MGVKRSRELEPPESGPAARPPSTTKGASPRLTKPERDLLATIDDAPEPERYDVVVEADRALVKSLIDKGLIRVRTIPRSSIPGATITHAQARKAVRSAMEQRAGAEGREE